MPFRYQVCKPCCESCDYNMIYWGLNYANSDTDPTHWLRYSTFPFSNGSTITEIQFRLLSIDRNLLQTVNSSIAQSLSTPVDVGGFLQAMWVFQGTLTSFSDGSEYIIQTWSRTTIWDSFTNTGTPTTDWVLRREETRTLYCSSTTLCVNLISCGFPTSPNIKNIEVEISKAGKTYHRTIVNSTGSGTILSTNCLLIPEDQTSLDIKFNHQNWSASLDGLLTDINIGFTNHYNSIVSSECGILPDSLQLSGSDGFSATLELHEPDATSLSWYWQAFQYIELPIGVKYRNEGGGVGCLPDPRDPNFEQEPVIVEVKHRLYCGASSFLFEVSHNAFFVIPIEGGEYRYWIDYRERIRTDSLPSSSTERCYGDASTKSGSKIFSASLINGFLQCFPFQIMASIDNHDDVGAIPSSSLFHDNKEFFSGAPTNYDREHYLFDDDVTYTISVT